MARVEQAWVRKALWAGRTYRIPSLEAAIATRGDGAGLESVSILTFLGSRRFGMVVATDTSKPLAGDKRSATKAAAPAPAPAFSEEGHACK
jgi:hypothetical protein